MREYIPLHSSRLVHCLRYVHVLHQMKVHRLEIKLRRMIHYSLPVELEFESGFPHPNMSMRLGMLEGNLRLVLMNRVVDCFLQQFRYSIQPSW